MQVQINTYQGLNMDTGYDSIPNSLYIDAKDIRITTTDGESMGSWTNIRGNKEFFVVPINNTQVPSGNNFGAWTASSPEIIGWTVIRNKIIVWVADNSGNKGWVYSIEYDPATREINSNSPSLVYYNPNLNFKKEWPIEAYGIYENDQIQRVYWTDYNNFFRSMNIMSPDLTTTPVGNLDIYPDVKFKQPLLQVISGGGALRAGLHQVAYRLKTSDGKETLISPPSNLIHVVSDSETLGQSAQYNGDGSGVNTGKSIEITVDTTDYAEFEKIEFVSIYHESATSTPEILAFEEVAINGEPSITVVLTGAESGAYVLESFDYVRRNYPFKTPKTITAKDNSLVIANIKQSVVNIQDLLGVGESFDARTRRYRNILGVIEPPNTPGTEPNDLANAFNEEYNSDKQWDPTWHSDSQYKYQSDGVTLGGEGPNISYKFHLEPFTLDGSAADGFVNVANVPDFVYTHDLADGAGVYPNTTFPNNASPFISGLLRGYKRGETYRFGIVFYTKKGEATYVEFIGDIKFPDISDVDSADTTNEAGIKYFPLARTAGGPTTTLGYSLGVEFTIDLSTCASLLTQIESYQIVRVKREEQDKRRVSQGVLKTFYNAIVGAPAGGINFDLQIPGATNSTHLHLFPYFPNTTVKSGSFSSLVDHSVDPTPTLPSAQIYNDYLCKADYLGIHTPEISYNYGNTRNLITALSNNPCILVTGAYYGFDSWVASGAPMDLTAENLANQNNDYRNTVRSVLPVTWQTGNANESPVNLFKKWKNNKFMLMNDTCDYKETVTGSFDGYYMRNYYVIDEWNTPAAHLNDPTGAALGSLSLIPTIYKSGTSIIGNIGQPANDFFTGNPISGLPGVVRNDFNAPDYIQVADPLTLAGNTALHLDSTPIIDIVLPKKEVYGGNNQSALETNIFIPASPIIDIADLNPIVYGGDTFIGMYTLQSGMIELSEDFYKNALPHDSYKTSETITEVYPVECSFNIDLAYGATIKTQVKYTVLGNEQTILRQETLNTYTAYGKTYSMYSFNPVYSKENGDLSYFVKPASILSDSLVNDTRAYLSNKKSNGEVLDSWTKFGVNDFYDVDDYGPINRIVNFKDSVFYLQDRAVGVYAINRAAITTTADGVPTELGTGQGFGKHQYITKSHGALHQWGVIVTDTGIYFFDAFHRKIFMIQASGGQPSNNPLSEIKGMHSYLQNLPADIFLRKENGGDNPILRRGVVLGKDLINDEVLFTFLGTGTFVVLDINTTYTEGTVVYSTVTGLYYLVTKTFTSSADKNAILAQLLANSIPALGTRNFRNDTLVYDELAQQFSSRYSATPKLWITNGDTLISNDVADPKDMYVHNIGDYGRFYNTVQECYIKLVVNPHADINKVLRTLEFNSILRDSNKQVDRTKTITAFQIENEYQTTGKILFSTGRIKRRFDKWRVKIARDQNSTNQRARLRSSHFVITLYFDNLENKEFIMNRLMSYYDVQIF